MRLVSISAMLGWVLGAFCVPLAIALGVAVLAGEPRAIAGFATTLLAALFTAGGLITALPRPGETEDLEKERIAVLAFGWIILSVAAGLPFYLSGVMPTLAASLFEGVSALTTTGTTAFARLADVPDSLIFWRALLQWIGGLGTVVSVAVLLAPARRNEDPGFSGLKLGHLSREGEWLPRTTFTTLVPLYVAITTVVFVGLAASAVPSFDALCLAFSAVSTGGMLPRDGAFELYGSASGAGFLTLGMVLGAISLLWLRALLAFDWRALRAFTEPVWLMAVFLALAGLIITAFARSGAPMDWTVAMGDALLALASAASLATTTGFEISERASLSVPYVVCLMVLLVGGGRFSTAGGIKYFRIGAMLRHCSSELSHLIHPASVAPAAGSAREADAMTVIWANFAFALFMLFAFASVVSLNNIDLPLSLLMSISAISNAGPGFLASAAPDQIITNPYPTLSALSHLALSAGMILGRLEIIALLTLFNSAFWRF